MFKFFIQILLLSYLFSSVNYNFTLIHNIPVNQSNSNSNFGVSDVWGYTDETGIEYAIVGYRYGTYILSLIHI